MIAAAKSHRTSFEMRANDDAQTANLAGLVIIATVLFNAILAIINGNLYELNSNHVIASEMMLFGAALALALRRYRSEMLPWFLLMFVAGLFAVLRWAGTGAFEAKYLRDVLLIPAFVILGMTVQPERLARPILLVALIAVAVMLLEAFFLPQYRDLFKVQEYYISTRDVDPASFWDTEVGLYPSAVREDRMLPFVDLHRLSSVFLEPVSLGNFCAILFAYLLAFGKRIPRRTYLVLAASVFALLVGCDGRLAIVGMMLIFAISLIAPFLPKFSVFLYLPFSILAVCVLTWTAGFSPDGNEFPNRLAHTVALLEAYGPMEYLGLSERFADRAVDSGIAYWIATQSALGVAVTWIWVMFSARQNTVPQVRYLHGIALYLSITMLVSASFASIKTAALMWFILGALQNDVPKRLQK